MASYLRFLLEASSVLDALSSRNKGGKKKPKRSRETPQDRFIKLMNHREWGPGIKDYLRRNPALTMDQAMYNIILKPDLEKWMRTGYFDGAEQRNPPNRQEIHDLDYRRHVRKLRLSSMIRSPEQNKGGQPNGQKKEASARSQFDH